jgi:hypothetical protein
MQQTIDHFLQCSHSLVRLINVKPDGTLYSITVKKVEASKFIFRETVAEQGGNAGTMNAEEFRQLLETLLPDYDIVWSEVWQHIQSKEPLGRCCPFQFTFVDDQDQPLTIDQGTILSNQIVFANEMSRNEWESVNDKKYEEHCKKYEQVALLMRRVIAEIRANNPKRVIDDAQWRLDKPQRKIYVIAFIKENSTILTNNHNSNYDDNNNNGNNSNNDNNNIGTSTTMATANDDSKEDEKDNHRRCECSDEKHATIIAV